MNVQEIAQTAQAPGGFDWDTIKNIIGGLASGCP
ncbi:MAG: hypothetical protein QOI78_2782 [Actinomycetota bacterium]|jgi:hypothetical protein|nr:hypothetical protein [Actinomycetota bacterium]